MEKCAACGEEFGCGNEEKKASCWCSDLPAVMPVEGAACLCPKCLRAEVTRRVGDCFGCAHSKALKTKSGSAIFLCGRAEKDSRYERYPRLPLTGCKGRA